MKKYRFRILGDNAENLNIPYHDGSPILFEIIFYSNEDEGARNRMADEITKIANNPQRVGAPMSRGNVEAIE